MPVSSYYFLIYYHVFSLRVTVFHPTFLFHVWYTRSSHNQQLQQQDRGANYLSNTKTQNIEISKLAVD